MKRLAVLLARVAAAAVIGILPTTAAHAQDVFSSQGRGPASDVFNSGPGPSPYGGPHPSRPTGRQAIQDDSVYCQQTPDGREIPKPYGGTRRNIPCGLPGAGPVNRPPPARRDPPVRAEPIPVFNFYYVNGINTPEHDADARGGRAVNRGSYDWDRQLIAGNLLGLDAPVNIAGAATTRAADVAALIRVAQNERDVFKDRTYNFSGLQPQWQGLCVKVGIWPFPDICNTIAAANQWRATWGAGMAGGDILECIAQAIGRDTALAADDPALAGWVDRIVQTYRSEARSNPPVKNYFILIGHSQGNFFVEGMAWRLQHLAGSAGREIFARRLAILSLASPTDYPSLQDGSPQAAAFMRSRLRHLTRADDAILGLRELNRTLGAKRPFDPNLPALWSWRPGALQDLLRVGAARTGPEGTSQNYSPLFEAMGWSPGVTCVPEGRPECNNALYTPLINAHLSDNYLSDPTLTRPGQVINQKALRYLDMNRMWTAPPSVLGNVRSAVRALKSELLVNG